MVAKKFFWRRFRRSFLLLLIPALIIGTLYLVSTVRRTNDMLKAQARNTLSAVSTNYDVVARETVYQESLLTNNSREMLALRRVLSKDQNYDYSDQIFLDGLETSLRSTVYSHSYLDSVYLYLDGSNNFMTADGIDSLETSYDTGWYVDYLVQEKAVGTWYASRRVKEFSYAPPVDVLTIYKRMTSTKGVIVLNIDVDKLVRGINGIVQNSYTDVCMLDQNDSFILGSRAGAEPQQTIEKENFFHARLPKRSKTLAAEDGQWIRIGGKNYLLNYQPYNQSAAFVSLTSLTAFMTSLSRFLIAFLTVLLLCGGLILVLSYLTTRRNFDQIQYMISAFDDAERGIVADKPKKPLDDEYDLIMNNVLHQYLYTSQMREQLKERQRELEAAELEALQLQINPHFIVNTLQTIDFEVRRELPVDSSVSAIIRELSDILSYALKSPTETIRLGDELLYLKEYVGIQRFRFNGKFIVYYEIDEGLMECRVMRLMLQPLIENSISHGVRASKHMGYIKLKIHRVGGRVEFRVVDNGVGMSRGGLEKVRREIMNWDSRESIGLTNVNKRLVLQYGEESGLAIRSKKGRGTCVSFSVPYPKLTKNVNNDTESKK